MKRITLEDLKNELKAFIESYFEECVAKYEDGHDAALMLHWFEETYMEKHMADMALDQVTFRIFLRKVLHNFYTKKEVDKKLNNQKWFLLDFINESILTVLPYKNENGELMTDKPIEELVGRVLYDFQDGVFTQYRDDAEGNIFNYVLSKEELRDFQIVFMENMPTLEESIYYMKDEALQSILASEEHAGLMSKEDKIKLDKTTPDEYLKEVSIGGENLPKENAVVDIPKATSTTLGVVKAGKNVTIGEDGSIDVTDEVIIWGEYSDANNYTETGIYHFVGFRTNANDNLPIDTVDAKANIAFTLIVDKSEGCLEGTTHVPTIVSQTLFLGNRQGSETKAYVRNCTIFFDGQPNKWESWRELMQTTYLGVIEHPGGYGLDGYNANEVLRGCTENGLYTGAFMAPPQIFDIFKLEVMNNYAMAKVYSVDNTVLQTLTILSTQGNAAIPTEGNGAHATLQRKGTWNGSAYEWTDWESQSFEVPTATQTTLGVVKGSSTVEVREDGSLQVNSDRLETAIADKLGAVRQGRNTLIDARGAINVDGISNTETDTDFSDGEINDIRVQIEPTKTIEELRYERTDVYDKGYSGFETKRENIPNPYPSGNDIQLIGRTDESGTRLDSSIYYEPNPSSFVEKEGLDYSSWSVTTDSFRNIWETAANMARSRIDALKKEGYGNENHGTTVDLRSGFGLYPYLGGRFVFVIKENLKSGCSTYHYLYNAKDELLGEFKYESGKGEVLTIWSPRADGAQYGFEEYLPLRIKTEFYKSEVAPTSGDFNLSLEIYTEEITNGMGDWSNPTINDKGRTFVLFAERYVEYPTTLKTADLTRCLSIGKNGILFQSAIKNSTGDAVTTTEKELYIKFDEEKGIITNIGDFIN